MQIIKNNSLYLRITNENTLFFSGVLFIYNTMEIFGKHLFGEDADAFINLPIMEQVVWIKKRTKQQNDNIIDEFLSNIKNNDSKECLNCGQNGDNKRERIQQPIEEINVTNVTEASSGVSTKRRGNNKKPKRAGL